MKIRTITTTRTKILYIIQIIANGITLGGFSLSHSPFAIHISHPIFKSNFLKTYPRVIWPKNKNEDNLDPFTQWTGESGYFCHHVENDNTYFSPNDEFTNIKERVLYATLLRTFQCLPFKNRRE